MITIHQRHRRTDGQTTCDRNTALYTKVHRAVKTVEVSIMKFSPYGRSIPLVFLWGKFHSEMLRFPRAEASNEGRGVGKISSFLHLSVNISKTVADTAKVTTNDY